jgi:hypothetical protein
VSTGRSIHAVPSITPSLREGIEDGPRLRLPRAPRIEASIWPKIGRDGIGWDHPTWRRQKAFLAVGSASAAAG